MTKNQKIGTGLIITSLLISNLLPALRVTEIIQSTDRPEMSFLTASLAYAFVYLLPWVFTLKYNNKNSQFELLTLISFLCSGLFNIFVITISNAPYWY